MTTNVFHEHAILDLNQSIDRVQFRKDGLAPPLATCCGYLFVPSTGTNLSPLQCMALQGFDVRRHDLTGLSGTDLCRLAGNAMSVPVIGIVCGIALSLLRG